MTNKILVAVVAVVIVVAAAAAAIVVLNGSDDSHAEPGAVGDFQLMVYGNANDDFTIDQSDKALIQDIIDGKIADPLKEHPLADVNVDGRVDETDLQLVQDIIDRKECTVNVACFDRNGDSTVMAVDYPVKTTALIGLNVINSALYANTGDRCIAYASPSGTYATAQASLGGEDLYAGGAFDWKRFMQIDTENPIGAVFIDYSYVSFLDESYFKDMEDAGIPALVYKPSDAQSQTSATATIGFLCGTATEQIGKTFADLSANVLDEIAQKTEALPEDERATFIATTMYIVIVNNSNAINDLGELAGGIPYYKTNAEFAGIYDSTGVNPSIINKESLANYQDADAYLSIRTSDFGSDPSETVIGNFEDVYYGICNSLDFYKGVLDRTAFVNNLLPGAMKAAYMAEAMYPDLFAGYGDDVAQQFLDCGFDPFEGQTVESILGCQTYQDYLDAKGAA